MRQVDLNSDIGEGFGAYTCGDDEAMLSIVTTANVACGFHAGDPEIMSRVFGIAKDRSVAVGAHPGFADLWGFGRRRIPVSNSEVEHLVAYQIGAAQALAVQAGHRLTHVKMHGALGNITEVDRSTADAVARAVRAVDSSLIVLAIARTEQVRAASDAGLRVAAEIFADRGYTEAGTLISRGQRGAVIHQADVVSRRVLAMLDAGAIITAAGTRLLTPIDSICVLGDSPTAVQVAARVRTDLVSAGVTVTAFSKWL
jgi:UPF0271 protein